MLAGMRRSALLLSMTLTACAPDLGECDPVAATAVAYDQGTGMPAYEGQALVIASCGNGAFCHGALAVGADRLGVPEGLSLDVRLAAIDGTVDEHEIERLRRGRFRVVQEAHALLHTVDLGTMPPEGEAAEQALGSAPLYARVSDEQGTSELPGVDTPEGREILRNWLACDAPVVERPAPRADGVDSVVVPPLYLPPIEPTWESIFDNVLGARGCAGARCHGGTEAGFRVTDPASTYDALVGADAIGDDCAGRGTLVVPGDPDASIFLQKLVPSSGVCGDPMPIGGVPLSEANVDAIRTWIVAGAPRE